MNVVYLGNLIPIAQGIRRIPGVQLVGCILEEGDDDAEELLAWSDSLGVPSYGVRSNPEIRSAFKRIGPVDLGVITNFGIILSPPVLAIPKDGFVNAHFGILPENPGRHPITKVLEERASLTGVTLHRVTEKPDAGPILDKRMIAVGLNPDRVDLFDRLTKLSHDLIVQHLSQSGPGR